MSKRALGPRDQLPGSPQRPQQVTLLTQIQICRRLGITVTTWRRWRAARRVPLPVPDLPGRPRWREAAIAAFERGLYRSGGRVFFGAARRAS